MAEGNDHEIPMLENQERSLPEIRERLSPLEAQNRKRQRINSGQEIRFVASKGSDEMALVNTDDLYMNLNCMLQEIEIIKEDSKGLGSMTNPVVRIAVCL